jgi:hypothetical protein
MDLNKKMITYLFDPDEGLAEDITKDLNALTKTLEDVEAVTPEALQALNISGENWETVRQMAEADVILFTEVWGKIRATQGQTVVEDPRFQIAESDAETTNRLLADFGLHEFLSDVSQATPGKQGLAQFLAGRGWRDVNLRRG